jgi:hypothetical protein
LVFAGGGGLGLAIQVVSLLSGWHQAREGDKKGKRRAWKERMVKAYDAYAERLYSTRSAAVSPSGYAINDYWWPDVAHKREAEAYLGNKGYYQDWKKSVQLWNDCDASFITKDESDVDDEFKKRIIDELSESGIAKENADYEYFATRILTCWKEGNGWTYSAQRLRQGGHVGNVDDAAVERLIGVVKYLIGSPLKKEHEKALDRLGDDLESQNQDRNRNWNVLLKARDAFLARLKQLRDDIDAEREVST